MFSTHNLFHPHNNPFGVCVVIFILHMMKLKIRNLIIPIVKGKSKAGIRLGVV